jgi:hypothetical protein
VLSGRLQCLLSRPDKEKPVTKVETKKETVYKYVLRALYNLLLTEVQDGVSLARPRRQSDGIALATKPSRSPTRPPW